MIHEFEVFSQRNEVYIIIFPNVPFWMATTLDGYRFLCNIKKYNDIDFAISKTFGYSTNNKKDIDIFVDTLIDSGVITENEKSLDNNDDRIHLLPNKITFLQTMKCNLSCRHCCVSNLAKQSDMKFETAKSVLKRCLNIMADGKKSISFLGGEPFCGDKFYDILEYAVSLGFEVGLSTNGMLIDENFAKFAADNSINVQISLDGTNKSEHEFIRGEDTWEKAIKAIELLIKNDVDIQTNFVYNKLNIKNLEQYFDLMKNLGVKKIRLTPLMNMGRAKDNFERVPLDEFVDCIYNLIERRKDLVEYIDETTFMGLVLNARFSEKMTSCGAGIITITISPEGDIYPCLNLYDEKFKMANILENDYIHQFKNSLIRKQFFVNNIDNMNNKCAKCNIRYFCGGKCRGETFQETGDITLPYPYCDEVKKSLEKIFWILTENPKLGEKKEKEISKRLNQYMETWH